jgi:hypothetical protein
MPQEEALNSIKALHLTAIPLRSKVAGELGRYTGFKDIVKYGIPEY